MEHEWILDENFGNEIQNTNFIICKKCKIRGWRIKDENFTYMIDDPENDNLSCEEIIIKNIIE